MCSSACWARAATCARKPCSGRPRPSRALHSDLVAFATRRLTPIRSVYVRDGCYDRCERPAKLAIGTKETRLRDPTASELPKDGFVTGGKSASELFGPGQECMQRVAPHNWRFRFHEVRRVNKSADLAENTGGFDHRHLLRELAGSVVEIEHPRDTDEDRSPSRVEPWAVADKTEQAGRFSQTILVLVAHWSDFQKPCHFQRFDRVVDVSFCVIDVGNKVARSKRSVGVP